MRQFGMICAKEYDWWAAARFKARLKGISYEKREFLQSQCMGICAHIPAYNNISRADVARYFSVIKTNFDKLGIKNIMVNKNVEQMLHADPRRYGLSLPDPWRVPASDIIEAVRAMVVHSKKNISEQSIGVLGLGDRREAQDVLAVLCQNLRYAVLCTQNINAALKIATNIYENTGLALHTSDNVRALSCCDIVIVFEPGRALGGNGQTIFNFSNEQLRIVGANNNVINGCNMRIAPDMQCLELEGYKQCEIAMVTKSGS